MKKRLILSPLLALFLMMFIVGCVPQKKEESKQLSTATIEATQASTQEMKTYVSKYGFSVSYPGDWHLDEDDYALGRNMEHGKVPFYLGNKNNEFFVDFSYATEGYSLFEMADIFEFNGDIGAFVDALNILTEKEQLPASNVIGGVAHVFVGKSKQNPDKQMIMIVALIYNKKTKVALLIEQLPMTNKELFMKMLRNIKVE